MKFFMLTIFTIKTTTANSILKIFSCLLSIKFISKWLEQSLIYIHINGKNNVLSRRQYFTLIMILIRKMIMKIKTDDNDNFSKLLRECSR